MDADELIKEAEYIMNDMMNYTHPTFTDFIRHLMQFIDLLVMLKVILKEEEKN